MKKHIIWTIVVTISVVIGTVAGIFAWQMYYDRKMPNFHERAEIYVYPNMNIADVIEILTEKNLVRKPGSLLRALRKENLLVETDKAGSASPKTGHYTIEPSNTSIYVARMLKNGWQTPVNLVLSGSIRLRGTLARKISSQMLMDSLTIMNALQDSALLAGYGFTPENVFGLFIPDTYQVYWTDSMDVVLDKQKAAFDSFWTDENKQKAKAQGLTEMEAVTLASIVRGESNYVPEYPLIAGVYLNRLHVGMKLQADPTVAFCFDYTLNRILKKHTRVESPYNTYMNFGLPPAPICSPGRECRAESERRERPLFLRKSGLQRFASFRRYIFRASEKCEGLPACPHSETCSKGRCAIAFRKNLLAHNLYYVFQNLYLGCYLVQFHV